MKPAFVIVSCLAVLFSSSLFADVLILKDGTVLKGSRIVETKEEVKIKGEFGDLPFKRDLVYRIIKDEKEGDDACPVCLGSGGIPCGECDGTRRARGQCKKCKGASSFVCKRCKGDGKMSCGRCNGHGEVRIRLRYGGYRMVKCGDCRGFGYLYCSKCLKNEAGKPSGREPCTRCKGDGAAPCKSCDRNGVTECILCDGSGVKEDSREFFLPSWRHHRGTWKAPEKTDLQRQEFWKWSQGKAVFWVGTVVEAG
ncbi:MAG: hypothetical protein ACYTFG_09145, partial [Planctomycetota bacterium]